MLVINVLSIYSESEERTLQLSEKKDEIHDKHMDKITVDDEIILGKIKIFFPIFLL